MIRILTKILILINRIDLPAELDSNKNNNNN